MSVKIRHAQGPKLGGKGLLHGMGPWGGPHDWIKWMGRTASTCQKLTTKHFQLNFDGECLCLHVEMISTAIRVSVGADPQKIIL